MESYDQIVKKLIKIIQLKSDDNIKQLEDLWESFEKTTSCQKELKRPLSIDSSLNSNESDTPNKKPKITRNSADFPNNDSIATNTNSLEQNSSSSFSTVASSSDTSPDSNDIFDDEMMELDFNCFICKQMNQEKNNKLIECHRCSKLYHQKCHYPVIEEKKNSSKSIEENKISWFIEKCQTCSILSTTEEEEAIISQNDRKDQTKSGQFTKFCNTKLSRKDYKKNLITSENKESQKNVLNTQPINVKK